MYGTAKADAVSKKTRVAPDAKDGQASGSVDESSARNGPAPQMRAASSSAGSIRPRAEAPASRTSGTPTVPMTNAMPPRPYRASCKPNARASRPDLGAATVTHPIAQMNGGMAAGKEKSAANARRPGRSVRKTSRASGMPRTSASPDAPNDTHSVLASAARSVDNTSRSAQRADPRTSMKPRGPMTNAPRGAASAVPRRTSRHPRLSLRSG
jgi:hypothetical protein